MFIVINVMFGACNTYNPTIILYFKISFIASTNLTESEGLDISLPIMYYDFRWVLFVYVYVLMFSVLCCIFHFLFATIPWTPHPYVVPISLKHENTMVASVLGQQLPTECVHWHWHHAVLQHGCRIAKTDLDIQGSHVHHARTQSSCTWTMTGEVHGETHTSCTMRLIHWIWFQVQNHFWTIPLTHWRLVPSTYNVPISTILLVFSSAFESDFDSSTKTLKNWPTYVDSPYQSWLRESSVVVIISIIIDSFPAVLLRLTLTPPPRLKNWQTHVDRSSRQHIDVPIL